MTDRSSQSSARENGVAHTAPIAFVDSSAIVALVDRNDRTHDAAVAAYHDLLQQGFRLFTTNFVIAETIALLTDGPGPDVARQWLRDQRLTVYHADEEDEQRARVRVVASRSKRGLTYTDAISAVVMERLGVVDYFAVDGDFLAD